MCECYRILCYTPSLTPFAILLRIFVVALLIGVSLSYPAFIQQKRLELRRRCCSSPVLHARYLHLQTNNQPPCIYFRTTARPPWSTKPTKSSPLLDKAAASADTATLTATTPAAARPKSALNIKAATGSASAGKETKEPKEGGTSATPPTAGTEG